MTSSIREAIAGLVTWLGFRVQTYASAVDFLQSPNIEDSSCIIADVHMPNMTGIELHHRLVELGRIIPMILITAFPDKEAQASALADGIVCYLGKPFSPDVLIECVRSALNPSAR